MVDVVNKLSKFGVVPVIDINDVSQALWLSDLLVEEGLGVAEVTLRSPNALDVLKIMKRRNPDLLIGAGTVLAAMQVEQAIDAGANFLVSPGLNPNVVEKALRSDIEIVPGVNNPTHIELAMSLGLNAVKFFPAEASGGVAFLKAILAPYANIKVMPTGGINEANFLSYLTIPQVFACGGSWFVSKALMSAGDQEEIRAMIRRIIAGLGQL